MPGAAESRILLPPAAIAFIRRRTTETAGLALIVLAALVAAALITYQPTDPSWSRAAPGPTRNILGPSGAIIADLLMQTLGLAAAVLCLTIAGWGWRLIRSQHLAFWWLRLVMLPVAVLSSSFLLGFFPEPASWITFQRGLGGAFGQLFRQWIVSGGMAPMTAVAIVAAIACASLVLALAVTWGEWRAIGRVSAGATAIAWRLTGGLGQRIAGFIARRPWRKRSELRAEETAAIKRDRLEPLLTGEEPPAAPAAPEPDFAPIPPRPTEVVTTRRAEPPRKPRAQQGKLDLPPTGQAALPPLDLLAEPRVSRAGGMIDEAALTQNARLLESVLDDFGVKGQITKVRPGPVVTLYELEPAPGTKTSRVIGLADDIARSMSAVSVRCAVIPGRNVIGIELPNATRETVYLRELLGNEEEMGRAGLLALALGKDIGGTSVCTDLAKMPHLLIAGTTGSGKSVAINTMILSLLYRRTPAECRFIMVDPKMLELSVYDGIPHLLAPVVTDPKKAVVALKWAVREMENRYRAMSRLGVRNIAGYNARLAEAKRKGEALTRKVQTGFDENGEPVFEEQRLDTEALPLIVVIVDEMADLMLVAGKDIEWAVQRLAQMARAAGIHLIMATQRPSVDVITGTIKANFPTRISFQVTSKIDSRTILGEQGAEQLLGQGDMLYMAGGGRITRVHGPFVSDREVEAVVNFLKSQGIPAYIEAVTEEDGTAAGPGDPSAPPPGDGEGGEADALYDQAVALVARERKCSTSFIQRYLQIGYNRAARIVERMEAEGVVSQANHVGKREVLAPKGDYAG